MLKKLFLGAVLLFFSFSAVSLFAQVKSSKKTDKPRTYKIELKIEFREKDPKKTGYEIVRICPSEILDAHSSGPKGTTFEITLKKKESKVGKTERDPGIKDDSFTPIPDDELKSYYLAELVSEEFKIAEITVRTGATPPPKITRTGEVPPSKESRYLFSLDEAGKKYTIKITKYNSFEEKLKGKEGGIPILQKEFLTNHRYCVGLDVGWFFPFKDIGKSYSLFYKNPSDDSTTPKRTLEEKTYYQTKAIVFVSIFPLGFEPEGPICSPRRLHLNIGTELSKSILDKLYFGVGYDFNFCSMNLFLGMGHEDSLPDEYLNWIGKEIPNNNIGSLPFVKKYKKSWGFAISIPFNFATTIGKIFGL
jgi:hypothetical protein